MSVTNWADPVGHAVWNDGNDVGRDWTPALFAEAKANGMVNTFYHGGDPAFPNQLLGATWVGIEVVPEPATLSLLLLTGLGVLGCKRR
jgi:hypothetical protein